MCDVEILTSISLGIIMGYIYHIITQRTLTLFLSPTPTGINQAHTRTAHNGFPTTRPPRSLLAKSRLFFGFLTPSSPLILFDYTFRLNELILHQWMVQLHTISRYIIPTKKAICRDLHITCHHIIILSTLKSNEWQRPDDGLYWLKHVVFLTHNIHSNKNIN